MLLNWRDDGNQFHEESDARHVVIALQPLQLEAVEHRDLETMVSYVKVVLTVGPIRVHVEQGRVTVAGGQVSVSGPIYFETRT